MLEFLELVKTGNVEEVNQLLLDNSDPSPINYERTKEDGFKNEKQIGESALHIAAQYGNLEMAQFLVENGAGIYKTKGNGATTLLLAAQNGHHEVVEFLLEKTPKEKKVAFINTATTDKNAVTPLYMAAQNGYLKIVESLLKEWCWDKVDCTIGNGWTALHAATSEGHTEIVKTLLNKDADRAIKSKKGTTVTNIATKKCHLAILTFLIGGKVIVDKKEITKRKFEKAEEDARNRIERSEMFVHLLPAPKDGEPFPESEKLKKEQEALKNAMRDIPDKNSLHKALSKIITYEMYGNALEALHHPEEEEMDHFLDLGLVNSVDGEGNTPLHYAAAFGHSNATAQKLIDHGAVVDSKNSHGKTPLEIVASGPEAEELRKTLREALTEKDQAKRDAKSDGDPDRAKRRRLSESSEDSLDWGHDKKSENDGNEHRPSSRPESPGGSPGYYSGYSPSP